MMFIVCNFSACASSTNETLADFVNDKTIILQIDNPIMKVNGEEKEIDTQYKTAPVIRNGRTLLPVRAIIEEIGGTVFWDEEKETVTLKYENVNITLTIGNLAAFRNGETFILDTAPIVKNNRTLLPIRFIMESFGYSITWDDGDRSIMIKKQINKEYKHLTTAMTISDLLTHPAFEGFAEHMLPYDGRSYNENMPLSEMSSLMVYHTHVNPENSVAAINRLIDDASEGKQIFYDFYTEEEKAADPSKVDTGLFFYRGEEGKPFAVQCAGGAFSYVGSLHESMPHCVEVNKHGYNAFAIKYRVGGEQYAAEDLAAAISFIIENADELGVSPKDYSVWGGSAGARMAADIGSYGTAALGGNVDSKPATVVMAYTGRSSYTPNDPPTYVIVGENDGIANHNTMKKRVDALSALGIDTKFKLCKNLGHGFGIGIGTTAEGWIDDAVQFWKQHIK